MEMIQAAINRKEWRNASERLDEIARRTRGDLHREPELLYWTAVVNYKTNDDGQQLTRGWGKLLDRFPDSEWAKRAEFIRRKS